MSSVTKRFEDEVAEYELADKLSLRKFDDSPLGVGFPGFPGLLSGSAWD
jgi:hypothetical protein